MSSSGITAVNSGPLILRTYLNSSSNNTYVSQQYDYPVSSNRILLTSTGGCLVPTDNLVISSITTSSFATSSLSASSIVASSIFASTISSNTISSLNGNISSLIVSSFSTNSFNFSTLIASTVGIGTSNPQYPLQVSTSGNIYSSTTVDYLTPGSFTQAIAENVVLVGFKIIGAGGYFSGGSGTGGTAGYIQGTFTLPPGTTQLKVVVGNSVAVVTPSGASYINVAGTGPLFAMAGAGGCGSGSGSGGYGGGGVFTSGVARGGDGSCTDSGASNPTVGLTGGGLGNSTPLFGIPCTAFGASNGGAAGSSGAFEEAVGGAGTLAGGNGYAAGGGYTVFSGPPDYGAGGGSSYFNSTYTTVTLSYPGNTLPAGIFPGYGRSTQSGRVQLILYQSNTTAIFTNGDIVANDIIVNDVFAKQVTISTVFTAISTSIYNTPGSYTVTLPPSTSFIDFEMIAAGGENFVLQPGGTGGYILGRLKVPPAVSTIKIKVGAITSGFQSGASYINVPTVGPLFVITGAGGGAGASVGGGGGGGGTFSFGVAPGLNGTGASFGGGGSQVGGAGSVQGGTAGTSGNAGQPYSTSNNFEESLGGAGSFSFLGGTGGNGFAGGGSGGGGGGGGSSYYDSSYVTIFTSYDGPNASTIGVLPGYGRSGQGGYVSVQYYTGSNSLTTNGTILCNNLQANGVISLPTGSMTIGSGAGTYALEVNATPNQVLFNTGWRYGNLGGGANTLVYDNINVKSNSGIWATIFFATSDKRIKNQISSIRDDDALQIVRKIDPVRYKYIDSASRHNEMEYGFIAQDVKSVLPYSVRTETDFIPNIYDMGDFTKIDSGASMITLRNKTVEHVQIGDSIKIIDLKEVQHVCKILDVNYNYLIVDTDLDNIVSKLPLTIHDIENGVQSNTVFVFGTRVDDLHVLDKHAIYSVNVAAVQEIDRIQQQQVSTIQGQEMRIKALEDKLELLSNKL